MENPSVTSANNSMTERYRIPQKWRDMSAYIACGLAAVCFAGLALRDTIKQRQIEQQAHEPQLTLVKASVLLAGRTQFLGEPDSPYTLVEFGDYECPPCRATQRMIPGVLSKYRGRVKLDFRQFPLTELHPHAEAAALAGASALKIGKFWVLHQRLYAADLSDPHAISNALAAAHMALDKSSAQEQIHEDATLAKQLAVLSTPTFMICEPNGKVFRLHYLQEIDSIFK